MTHPTPTKRGRYRRPPRAGAPPKHGARALARHLIAGTLDQRTWVARALRDIRQELAADAGGYDQLTARERLLIDRCAAAALICSTIEAHVFGSGRLVDDAGELLPLLRKGYVSHVQSLSRMLQALGLRPDQAAKAPSLEEYLAARTVEPAAAPQSAPLASASTPTPDPIAADAAAAPAASREPQP